MAAYAALASLMNLIHDIQNHHSPPVSLDKQQVESLTEINTFLQEFLEAYISPVVDIDNEADPLEIRIADAAYAVEDVIESHLADVIKLSRSTNIHDPGTTLISGQENNCREEEVNCIKLYKNLHQVIEEMDLIKKVAMNHDEQQRNEPASAASLKSYSSTGHKITSMVCSDHVLHGIMEKLVAGPLDRHVIPIVGMGGIGKTTLTRNIYAQPLINEHFDICVWATISHQYNTKELICQLLSRNEKELSESSEDELGLELHKYLFGRRFLIIMDDMWSIDAYDKIQCFLPNNENGSRILVTTRLSQLSSQLNNNYSHQMEFLDDVSSWDLFSKVVFEEAVCPLELEKIGMDIVENCRGLPLSIVVVGGILKNMERTLGSWESIRNNLISVVNLENNKHCLRLLKISYNHLPVYLKPCFLYMAIFEEDKAVLVSRLIKLWVSEGFLKPINGKSMETVARGFFKDLVDRNLILIHELGYAGKVKYCKIHDLLRDLCIRECRKYGFYHVIGQGSPLGINSQRRVVIPKNTLEEKDLDALEFGSTRSVICEYEKVPTCQNFGLLRTFDAYHTPSSQNYMNALAFQCVNLRHLAIKVCSMSSFLKVNLVWNLSTLIVDCWDGCNALVGIWEMPQFRHIELTRESTCLPDPPSSNGGDEVVVMENLEVLKGVRNFKCGEEVVMRIPNVRKLRLIYRDCDDDYCLSNIRCLCKLESLYVSCDERFRGVASLYKVTFPHSLTSLHLLMKSDSKWEGLLEKISLLPVLQKLKLVHGCFGSGKWEIDEGRFPSLKYLSLSWCRGLKHWTTQDSSIFPRLEQLRLVGFKELKEIPSEIGYIPTLQKIWLQWCSESAVRSIKEIVDEQLELQCELSFHVNV